MTLHDLPPDHDLAHLETALRFVKRFDCAVDGGAHRGIWSSVMAQRFMHVIAFEPVAENAEHIPTHRTRVIRAALGAVAGLASIASGPENTGQWHLAGGSDIPVMPLDHLGLTSCDFLKLDVEGYELRALEGAEATIRRCRPVVLIEENGLCTRYGIKPGEAPDFLASLGMHEVARCNKDLIFVWGDP